MCFDPINIDVNVRLELIRKMCFGPINIDVQLDLQLYKEISPFSFIYQRFREITIYLI